MVEEESDDSSEYSDDEDELGNKVSISGYTPQNIFSLYKSTLRVKKYVLICFREAKEKIPATRMKWIIMMV